MCEKNWELILCPFACQILLIGLRAIINSDVKIFFVSAYVVRFGVCCGWSCAKMGVCGGCDRGLRENGVFVIRSDKIILRIRHNCAFRFSLFLC